MVLLTMTDLVVEALEVAQKAQPNHDVQSLVEESEAAQEKRSVHEHDENNGIQTKQDANTASLISATPLHRITHGDAVATRPSEPTLLNPKVGNAITHGQIIDLARNSKSRGLEKYRLELLLKCSRVYIPPCPAKAEPTSEYKALMARLRREEEERNYSRMTNPPPPMETFAQRFSSASAAYAFSSNHQQLSETPEDEVTYADIDRQIALIFNVLVSIVACAGAIWVAARWWSTPMRLALSMSGSLLVGVAEVVVYAGYIRRVGEAKGKEKGIREIKEVVNTWVVGAGKEEKEHESIVIESKVPDDTKARKRK